MSVERGEVGFELGAATMNVIFTLGVLLISGAITVAVTYPEIHVASMMIVAGVAALLLPVLFYPFSYSLWFAVELLMDPPGDEAITEARRRVATVVSASE